ncbi:hypothetical protein G3545_25865 [Starkeya sp. ORNL1]|uniref:hypothetical protein n=1 Tax=Starkeya sp. ORNL1 TaxID=2709380 RepID=UPI00146388B4|nr:hypothetical protein [Starkeya sp. ORNL1]QJP16765.1 hypothetical protein G3545_25865 [Starkeya sp. ORNL1]
MFVVTAMASGIVVALAIVMIFLIELARNASRMRMHQAPISTVIVVLDENDEVVLELPVAEALTVNPAGRRRIEVAAATLDPA